MEARATRLHSSVCPLTVVNAWSEISVDAFSCIQFTLHNRARVALCLGLMNQTCISSTSSHDWLWSCKNQTCISSLRSNLLNLQEPCIEEFISTSITLDLMHNRWDIAVEFYYRRKKVWSLYIWSQRTQYKGSSVLNVVATSLPLDYCDSLD